MLDAIDPEVNRALDQQAAQAHMFTVLVTLAAAGTFALVGPAIASGKGNQDVRVMLLGGVLMVVAFGVAVVRKTVLLAVDPIRHVRVALAIPAMPADEMRHQITEWKLSLLHTNRRSILIVRWYAWVFGFDVVGTIILACYILLLR